ncbi:MAG TPA: DUF1232 domain-containing protein [Phocaeicola coprocola]|jgi:uncharacterized membrane protein YkvA (DUF1232 family)|uniref:DUF1232 domain-containing protein n=1 Tax=Phocaeicola coprocola TaxID=310298 RepID=A0A921FDL8_9BACT|nr:DUF1232 domain-containing protein [Phocaeicola coprocola]
MDKIKLLEKFKEKWMSKAKEYVETPERIKKLIPQIKNYLSKKGLKEVKEKVTLLIDYLNDIANGNYKNYNVKALLYVVAAMIYLVSPIDVIPDFILGVGFTDDVAVILFVLREISLELDKYKEWKLNKK